MPADSITQRKHAPPKLSSNFMTSPSIHAPVKGATLDAVLMAHDPKVSIHAPVKGATSAQGLGLRVNNVSIHARCYFSVYVDGQSMNILKLIWPLIPQFSFPSRHSEPA